MIDNTDIEDFGDGKYKISFKCPIKGMYQLRLILVIKIIINNRKKRKKMIQLQKHLKVLNLF